VWVNGDEPAAGNATLLSDGDEVAVIPPVSGGADDGVTAEELERLGLYDPNDPHAAQRLELLRLVLELGGTVEEIREMGDEVALLPSHLALRPGRERLTLAEAAERAGVPLDTAARVWRAFGLPHPGSNDRICTEADVEVLGIVVAGQHLLGEEVALQLARTVGSAVARMGDAARSAFIVRRATAPALEDPVGLDLARANVEAVALVPGMSRAIDVMLRHHFELVHTPLDAVIERGYDGRRLAVGFVDLVGSTALARQLSIEALGAALGEFEAIAADTVAAGGGRLVKLIGDEVMFVVEEPEAACEIAVDLVDALAAHPTLPSARGGLAAGEVLTREGDYFGPVVNLAARTVGLASPGAVVSAGELRPVKRYRLVPIGTREIRGFDDPVELHRVERA
jgi:adenylate cyclase